MNARREVVAIIPARGGSKGIPRKNIVPVGGRPLLAHTIAHARQSPEVTRIVVSTDDEEIAAVARAEGAEVVWRPADIAGDTASSESALVHALEALQTGGAYEPHLVVFLQATSPLRRPDDVSRAIRTLEAEGADSLFSACATHGFLWRSQDGELVSVSYDYQHRPRRQDIPEELVENGSIYIFRPWVLRDTGNRLGGKIAVHRMDPLDSFQIDEPGDLAIAERLLSLESIRASAPDSTERPASLSKALAAVRLLVLDFDGVLTDNRVLVDADGHESAWCNRSDGWGIARLLDAGFGVLVLSTEKVAIAAARSRKLGIECIHGCDDKLARLKALAQERGLSATDIAYVGNDVNDLSCLNWVGVPIAVADARDEVLDMARWTTPHAGGGGAVRDVADALLAARAEHKQPAAP